MWLQQRYQLSIVIVGQSLQTSGYIVVSSRTCITAVAHKVRVCKCVKLASGFLVCSLKLKPKPHSCKLCYSKRKNTTFQLHVVFHSILINASHSSTFAQYCCTHIKIKAWPFSSADSIRLSTPCGPAITLHCLRKLQKPTRYFSHKDETEV